MLCLAAALTTSALVGLPESLSGALSRSELLRSILPLAAAAGSFRLGAAAAVINQPRLPPISGSYEHVGVRIANVGGARVKVFYPAAGPSSATAPYCTDGRTTSDGMAGLVGFRQLGLSFLLAHLADAPSGCWLDAPPVATPSERLPLLVYSHGFGGNMDMASYLFRAFAAAGIVVAAVEHTDGTASYTELPDGTPLPFSPGALSRSEQLTRRATELLAAAAPGALGPPGSLPLTSDADVFLGGHSYGGPAALLAASLASSSTSSISPPSSARPIFNLKGLLLHDPALGMNAGIDAAVGRGASKPGLPTLSYVSDEYDAAGVRCGDATLHTIGGFHGNFVDAPLWAPSWVMRPLSALIPAAGPADPLALHEVLAKTAKVYMRRASATGAVPTEELLAAAGGGSLPRAGASTSSVSRLLELRGGGCFSSSAGASGTTPSEVLMQWRNQRLARFAESFDGSRYHAQVLFVDDDGARARTCEALLERVAMWSDAGWWLYPHAASTSVNVADGQAAPPSLLATASRVGLCPSRLSARAATLDPSDLLSYDLIVCVDLTTLDQVRDLPTSPHISPHLPTSPHTSPHLPTSPTSPLLPCPSLPSHLPRPDHPRSGA